MRKKQKEILWNLEKLTLYFLLSGFIGWIIENTINILIFKHYYVNILFLPFSFVYGLGAVILGMIFPDDDFEVVNILIFGGLILAIYQYIMSFLIENLTSIRAWDYSLISFNLNGRISLITSILLSLLALVTIKYFNPLIKKIFYKYRYRKLFDFTLVLLAFFVFLDLIIQLSKISL